MFIELAFHSTHVVAEINLFVPPSYPAQAVLLQQMEPLLSLAQLRHRTTVVQLLLSRLRTTVTRLPVILPETGPLFLVAAELPPLQLHHLDLLYQLDLQLLHLLFLALQILAVGSVLQQGLTAELSHGLPFPLGCSRLQLQCFLLEGQVVLLLEEVGLESGHLEGQVLFVLG